MNLHITLIAGEQLAIVFCGWKLLLLLLLLIYVVHRE